MEANNWSNLPRDILCSIAQMLKNLEDFINFSIVCKSWKFVASTLMEKEKPCLPTRYPWLLLAEEDPEVDVSAAHVGSLEAYYSKAYHEAGEDANVLDYIHSPTFYYSSYVDDEHNREAEQNREAENREADRIIPSIGDLFRNINTTRGLFSIKTGKVYNLDLPEAMDKLVLGTNKGWLITLGRDLEINLLHPFSRHQIPLPPMLALPSQYEYDDDFPPQSVYDMFIAKVVMSSRVPIKSTFQGMDTSDLPIVMAIYGELRILGFARLGDKLWTNIKTSTLVFDDVVYHKEQFFALDCHGDIFLCDIDKKQVKAPNEGKKIVSVPVEKDDDDKGYLIESLSGSHMWLVVRFLRAREHCDSQPMIAGKFRYHTTEFTVYKLEVQSCDNDFNILSDWKEVKDLGNEAIFVGITSSVSVAASEFVKPNSIYFTDDNLESFCQSGGGHDMGIYNVKTGTIEPHFQGVSIHRFSPPIWYI